MIFGYLPAVLGGFLLTAIPNWTGRPPVQGAPLALLVILWLAGRLAMLCPAGGAVSGAIDSVFLVALAGVACNEIVRGGNRRNLPVGVLVSLLALANVLFHFGAGWGLPDRIGQRLGLALATLLMALIGGRIIPAFTTNWMKQRGLAPLPAPFSGFDRLAIVATAVALIGWVAGPTAAVSGGLLMLAGLLHVVRLARWRGWLTSSEPLVTVLHVAYAWMPLALLLMGLAILRPGWIAPTQALHALTAGAVAQLTLAVMTRATLGHTGSALTAGAATVAIYALVFVGAALRLILPFTSMQYAHAMAFAAAPWSAGFLLFVVVYGPSAAAPAPPVVSR